MNLWRYFFGPPPPPFVPMRCGTPYLQMRERLREAEGADSAIIEDESPKPSSPKTGGEKA